jgi:hypothetical protein
MASYQASNCPAICALVSRAVMSGTLSRLPLSSTSGPRGVSSLDAAADSDLIDQKREVEDK